MSPRGSHGTFEVVQSAGANVAPERVMRWLRDPASWPSWQSEILTANGPAPLQAGDLVEGRAKLLGFEVDGRSLATVAAERTFEEDVVVGVRMRIHYEVTSRGGRTSIRHHLKVVLPRGLAGSVLALLLRWRLRRMQAKLLQRLVRQAESEPSL